VPDLALDILDSLADRSPRRGASEVWIAEDTGAPIDEVRAVLLDLADRDHVRLRSSPLARSGWYITPTGWAVLP
jgi:transcription initiation factor IIE alpha subunit